MTIKQIHDGGVLLITPDRAFKDSRGMFIEAYRVEELRKSISVPISYGEAKLGRGFIPTAVQPLEFVQSNFSISHPWVLRGMHYQLGKPQGKLIRCTAGRIYQVAVDMRKGSPTFGTWVASTLDMDNCAAVWVPPGFANGFIALNTGATVWYDMTAEYDQVLERSFKFDDAKVAIQWPGRNSMRVSEKDSRACALSQAEPWEGAMPPRISLVPASVIGSDTGWEEERPEPVNEFVI